MEVAGDLESPRTSGWTRAGDPGSPWPDSRLVGDDHGDAAKALACGEHRSSSMDSSRGLNLEHPP
jgi:hypothetical protein